MKKENQVNAKNGKLAKIVLVAAGVFMVFMLVNFCAELFSNWGK
ncbi:MAG: hypothetical protein ACOX47_13960 [Bacillota bacterium]